MNIGKMDRRITLRMPVETGLGGGVKSTAWEDVATVWAHKREESGKERLIAGRIQDRQAVVWTIRYREVTGSMRIAEDGAVYEIAGTPREIGRRRFLEITSLRVP